MAVNEKLNAEWAIRSQGMAVFKAHGHLKHLRDEAVSAKEAVDAIIADASFSNVDQEVKVEGAALITLLNQFVTALASHSEFLDWTS